MMKFLAMLLLLFTTANAQLVSRRVAAAGGDPTINSDSMTYRHSWKFYTAAEMTVSASTDYLILFAVTTQDAYHEVAQWGSQDFTLLHREDAGSQNPLTSVFGLENPTAGTDSIRFTQEASGAIHWHVVGVENFTAIDDADSTNSTWSPANSTLDISSASGKLVIDGIGNAHAKTFTVGAGQSVIYEHALVSGVPGLRISTEGGSATTTMSWTFTDGISRSHIAMEIE